jgi:hypothetical protein
MRAPALLVFNSKKCLHLPRKNFKKMIENTDKRHAGGVPAAADGTAKNRMYGVFQIENRLENRCVL